MDTQTDAAENTILQASSDDPASIIAIIQTLISLAFRLITLLRNLEEIFQASQTMAPDPGLLLRGNAFGRAVVSCDECSRHKQKVCPFLRCVPQLKSRLTVHDDIESRTSVSVLEMQGAWSVEMQFRKEKGLWEWGKPKGRLNFPRLECYFSHFFCSAKEE